MPGSRRNKSVSFGPDEEHLLSWAEDQPGGFSRYVKGLITKDQTASQQNQQPADDPQLVALVDRLVSRRLAELAPLHIQDSSKSQPGEAVTSDQLSGLF